MRRRGAPATQSLRATICNEILKTEEELPRLAYMKQPDSEAEADDWSTAEEWKQVKL